MNKLDLHMHSNYSDDGQYTPTELLTMAKEKGIEYIAIADHNTVQAHLEGAHVEGVTLIPAVELDVMYKGMGLHLLGYGIDVQDPIYTKIHKDIETQELVASQKRVQLVEENLGLIIDQDKLNQLCPNGIYTGESICEVILQDPRNLENEYILPYLEGGSRSDNPFVNFYWDYCAQGKCAYVEMKFIELEEAILMYHKQEACIVLAHPGNQVKENETLLKELVSLGIDGIEVYSSYHSPTQIEWYLNFVEKHNLLATCGSDFHGKTKPAVKMGLPEMPQELQEKLLIQLKTNL